MTRPLPQDLPPKGCGRRLPDSGSVELHARGHSAARVNRWVRAVVRAACCGLGLGLAACTSLNTPDSSADPSPLSASQAPLPANIRLTSVLLDFESASDSIFVALDHGSKTQERDSIAGGKYSLKIDAMASRIDVKFATLISGRSFPAGWTLLGGYFKSDWPMDVRVVLLDPHERPLASRTAHLPANQWTACLYDLTDPATVETTSTVRFELINRAPGSGLRMDNLVLIDNTETLVNTFPRNRIAPSTAPASRPAGSLPESWRLVRVGYKLILDSQVFGQQLYTSIDGALDGWQVIEANPMRILLRQGQSGIPLCIYSDGRQYKNGQESLIASNSAEPSPKTSHSSLAKLTIPDEQGRIDRRSPGDANNDGYNEQRGAYQVVATGNRLNIQISPREGSIQRPVLEISGLPAGEVLITAEGMLITQTQRLPDGRLLVRIPLNIERPTQINLRLK